MKKYYALIAFIAQCVVVVADRWTDRSLIIEASIISITSVVFMLYKLNKEQSYGTTRRIDQPE